jgi:hypothetical protein
LISRQDVQPGFPRLAIPLLILVNLLPIAGLIAVVKGYQKLAAAFEVGYESASQFDREYRRFFGQPPIRDIKAF